MVATKSGQVSIRGWSCDNNVNQSIQVHLYLGGTYAKGERSVKSVTADRSSELAVSNACNTKLTPHRFNFLLSNSEWEKYATKKVYVYGISVSGGRNKLLINSGNKNIPIFFEKIEEKLENKVIGSVEKVDLTSSGNVDITGWACDTNIGKSIDVHLYLGGAAGSAGVYIKTIIASMASGSYVRNACGSNFNYHRYKFSLPMKQWKLFSGKKVYIHGISKSGGSNNLLLSSGLRNIPIIADGSIHNVQGKVIGDVEKIMITESGSIDILGWACDANVEKSIDVHLYMGGAAGEGGTILKRNSADMSSEAYVNNSCNTNLNLHRFKFNLSKAQWKEFANKKIYVHGISVSGGKNNLLANSGTRSIPSFRGIKGHIDTLEEVDSKLLISGWACDYGVNSSISVKFLSSENTSAPILFKEIKTSLSTENGVHEACGTTSGNHRFKLVMSRDEWQHLRQQKLFVSGHPPTDMQNGKYLLRGAGSLFIPDVSMNLSDMKLSIDGDLVIPLNDVVVINQSRDIRHLIIKGELRCQSGSNSFNLDVKGISVMGKFSCGSSSSRFSGKLNIRFKEGFKLIGQHGIIGQRSFVVMDGAEVHFFGKSENSGKYRISQTAQVGERSIRLNQAAKWSVGDMIVLSSTGFDMNEAERLTITGISTDKKTISFNKGLAFRHWGVTKNYTAKGKTYVLDERAYVANLSRNIKIYPYLGNYSETQIGAHMMMMAGAKAYVDSVELINMGQLGKMGRYPFHWHHAGNVKGQFIKNSSIRDSYQRCVTLHDTNYATVENNVCYNHNGHGIFLESGSERKNVIKGNLVLVSKKIAANRALLVSDVKGSAKRFPAPGSYWISNPDNYIVDNVASGSDGSGFWMSYEWSNKCNKDLCSIPVKTNTLAFDNNTAHSSRVGMTWDGAPGNVSANNPLNPGDKVLSTAHYRPSVKAVFNDLKVFKNSESGMYFRGDAATFNNNIVADNKWGLFFAYSQHFKNSAIIGKSENYTRKDLYKMAGSKNDHAGAVLYDGPLELENVAFFDFPTAEIFFNNRGITPIPIRTIGGHNKFENKSKGLTFSPEPWKRVYMDTDANHWTDSDYANSLRDLDGSLTGIVGGVVVPKNKFNHDATCINKDSWKAKICRYKPFLFLFYNFENSNKNFFIPTSPSGVRAYGNFSDMYLSNAIGPGRSVPYHNKFNGILGKQGFYQMDLGYGMVDKKHFLVRGQAEANNVISPLVRINNKSCYIKGFPQVSSLSALRTLSGAGVYKDGTNTYFKLKTTALFGFHRNSEFSNVHQGSYDLYCD